MGFAFYNVTSIRCFTSMLTVVYENTRMLWVFPTTSKIAHVCIIHLIIKTIMNEQHPCKRVIVDKYSALENSIDVTNLLIDKFRISMKTTGGDASWLNGTQ